MLHCQQTHKTHLNYHLVAVQLPFTPKAINRMHQTVKTYLERGHSILLFVTRTLYVHHESVTVSVAVQKMSVVLRQAWSES